MQGCHGQLSSCRAVVVLGLLGLGLCSSSCSQWGELGSALHRPQDVPVSLHGSMQGWGFHVLPAVQELGWAVLFMETQSPLVPSKMCCLVGDQGRNGVHQHCESPFELQRQHGDDC